MSDEEIVDGLLNRNNKTTIDFLYGECYPMFCHHHKHYKIIYETVEEYINDIYQLLITPSPKTHKCRLETFAYRCKLKTWISTVSEHYCWYLNKKYKSRTYLTSDEAEVYLQKLPSEDADHIISNLDREDLEKLLKFMESPRDRYILKRIHVDGFDIKEVIKELDMPRANFDNAHKRARDRFRGLLQKYKEGLL